MATRLPELAGRRNGRLPMSGEYWPILIVGNAGLTAGLRTPLLNDFVTTASTYVYAPRIRSRPIFASAESSRPLDVLDWELTYAPKPDAAAAAAGTPSCGSQPLLTYSIRSSNALLK